MFHEIIKLLRMKQWIKNTFVLAPLLFSHSFIYTDACIKAALAFVVFCLASSAVYILNDIADKANDAIHPLKKARPIASGKISPFLGMISAFGCLFAAGLISVLFINTKVLSVVGIYLLLNVLYSVKLKNIVIVDVLTIAFGFILRVYAGAYAIDVPASNFIFMTTFFLALFLGFCKRKKELQNFGAQARHVLADYTEELLNQYVIISVAATIMCYTLYTLEATTQAYFKGDKIIYSIVFVVWGIFRYQYIISRNDNTGDPTENLLTDKSLILICVLYVCYIMCLLSGVVI